MQLLRDNLTLWTSDLADAAQKDDNMWLCVMFCGLITLLLYFQLNFY
jgi:hypothetical protein